MGIVAQLLERTRKEKMMNIGIPEIFLMMCIGLILLALFVAGVVLVIWLVRRSNKAVPDSVQAPGAPATALSLAQDRYARGEISREEYQQIVSDLSQK